jgi:hypothetical protein
MTGEDKAIIGSLKTREVVVRRICLAALAITASSVAVATAVAPAGAKTHSKTTKPAPVKVIEKCTVNESIAVPAGTDAVSPPVSSGQMYGTADCNKSFGKGVQSASLQLQDTGDLTGTWWHYGKTGAIWGTYDLTQSSSNPSNPASFDSASYTGVLKVVGGSGAFAGATGTGTSTCNTPDSVHVTCTEKLKFKLPASAASAKG